MTLQNGSVHITPEGRIRALGHYNSCIIAVDCYTILSLGNHHVTDMHFQVSTHGAR